jgi:hypothetical protein
VRAILKTAIAALLALGAATLAVYAATAKPDFGLSASPARRVVEQGRTAKYSVKITSIAKFNSAVTLTVAGVPRGTKLRWKLPDGRSLPVTKGKSVLPKGKRAAVLSIVTSATTPAATKTLAITGSSGALKHTKKVKLAVTQSVPLSNPGSPQPTPQPAPDERTLTVVASPASRNVVQTDSTTYSIDITRGGGLTGPVALSVSGLPSGATGTFSPQSADGSSSTLTVDTTQATPTGSFDITVNGSASGISGAGATTLVVAQNQPFTISGDVATPLYPGAPPQALDLTLANPNDFAITVRDLGVGLGTTQAGCNVQQNYRVTPAAGFPITLQPGSHKLSELLAPAQLPKVQMLETGQNQNGCSGAPIALTYSGSATR